MFRPLPSKGWSPQLCKEANDASNDQPQSINLSIHPPPPMLLNHSSFRKFIHPSSIHLLINQSSYSPIIYNTLTDWKIHPSIHPTIYPPSTHPFTHSPATHLFIWLNIHSLFHSTSIYSGLIIMTNLCLALSSVLSTLQGLLHLILKTRH